MTGNHNIESSLAEAQKHSERGRRKTPMMENGYAIAIPINPEATALPQGTFTMTGGQPTIVTAPVSVSTMDDRPLQACTERIVRQGMEECGRDTGHAS